MTAIDSTRGTALQAWRAAFKILKERHAEEWADLHRVERLALGLSPEAGSTDTTEALLRKLDNVREREATYLKKLALRGVKT